MNRISRMLMVGGLGLVAGITFGVGPAAAATSTDAGATKTAHSQDRWFGNDNDNDRRFHIGRDRDDRYGPMSRRQCYRAAAYLERRYDVEADCEPGRRGWYMEIDRDHDDWDFGDSRRDWYRILLAKRIIGNFFN